MDTAQLETNYEPQSHHQSHDVQTGHWPTNMTSSLQTAVASAHADYIFRHIFCAALLTQSMRRMTPSLGVSRLLFEVSAKGFKNEKDFWQAPNRPTLVAALINDGSTCGRHSPKWLVSFFLASWFVAKCLQPQLDYLSDNGH